MGVFRLFLALSVLLGHTRGHGFFGFSFLFNELAVQTFFMISGFYMALVLNEKYVGPGRYWTFVRQRFLRLYPTYLILLLFVVLVDSIVYEATGNAWGSLKSWSDNAHLLSPAGIAFFIVENLIILGQDVVMILGLDPTTGSFQLFWHQSIVKPVEGTIFLLISPSWSLAVEFSFYLLAPFLVCRPVRSQLVILFLSLAFRMALFLIVPPEAARWSYSLFPSNLFLFMAGSLAYVVYKNYAVPLKQLALSKPWIIVIFALIALEYRRFPGTHELFLVWIPLAFLAIPLLFTLTCRNRVDRLIGELSFPCYLIHAHVLMFTVPLFLGTRSEWLLGPVSVALSLILSYLFYRFIESKTERFREHLFERSQRKLADTAPSAMPTPATSAS